MQPELSEPGMEKQRRNQRGKEQAHNVGLVDHWKDLGLYSESSRETRQGSDQKNGHDLSYFKRIRKSILDKRGPYFLIGKRPQKAIRSPSPSSPG